jgi:hypothetical protein
MLTFEESAITMLIDQHRRAMNANRINTGWGCGPIIDNFSGLQGAFFRLLGKQDRTPGNYPRDSGDGAGGGTNEFIHPIVRIRKIKVPTYNPPSLQGLSLREPNGSRGWTWARKGVEDVPEYVMNPGKKMIIAYMKEGIIKFREDDSLSRQLCPKNILMDLDRENAKFPS